MFLLFFFFNDTATTEIYTLSLHDALPISGRDGARHDGRAFAQPLRTRFDAGREAGHPVDDRRFDGRAVPVEVEDRKSTRLNSSHSSISYAVFCLKKKKIKKTTPTQDS